MNKKLKKVLSMVVLSTLAVTNLAGCGGSDADTAQQAETSSAISVISREDGSGTRGAFVELFGVEQKNEAGEKEDMTTEEASITNSTSVMMTTVAGNVNAIGYISLGSLNDTVKAVNIDGVAPSVDAIKGGSYKISRPFNVVPNVAGLTPEAQDFMNYIMSADGQAVVEENGYIASVDNAEAYTGGNMSGKVIVTGSSSVTPVMEKLKEAYVALNPDMTVEVQMSDSSTGVTSAIDGTCDLGMASRELKDSETEKGAVSTAIALDGIAVIVNNDAAITDLTAEQVKDIYTGVVTDWSQLNESK
ncbi:MAG: substrate-binding domain-containing protein [Peptococcaceae bacterium]|nr:substrate-binding domain-containing protein [Peptococcaceae bacterium]